MTWGSSMTATGVRVVPCSNVSIDGKYVWYAGGFYATKPKCLHLVVDLGARQVNAEMPFGVRC